jgi:biopolymer transport protein ExbB
VFSILHAAGWPVWPLILCSVLVLAVIIERLIVLRTARVLPHQALPQALQASAHGLPNERALSEIENTGVVGAILGAALRAWQQDPQIGDAELRAQMEMQGRVAAQHLERHLSALGTLASAAPLMGLLGTVVGMIEMFSAQASGIEQPAQLAHGISVALYSTAYGLVVAIPALLFWRYLRARADQHLLALELAADRFARHLAQVRR